MLYSSSNKSSSVECAQLTSNAIGGKPAISSTPVAKSQFPTQSTPSIATPKRVDSPPLAPIASLNSNIFLIRPLSNNIIKGDLSDGALERRYDIQRTIGQGEFARVKLAIDRQTGQKVAIKMIKLPDQQISVSHVDNAKSTQRAHRIAREIQIMEDLASVSPPCLNLVHLQAVWRISSARMLAMVMEYAPHGELFDHVQKKRRLSEQEARGIMWQIMTGVTVIHGKGYVHRDLKLENILLGEGGRVLVSDFGFATRWREEVENGETGHSSSSSSLEAVKLLMTSCGSPCYAAPELVFNKTGYSGPPVDIWSCGVILYAMLMGHLPFEEEAATYYRYTEEQRKAGMLNNVFQLYQFIEMTGGLVVERDGQTMSSHIESNRSSDSNAGKVSKTAANLVQRMLDINPETRITLTAILEHPWMQGHSEMPLIDSPVVVESGEEIPLQPINAISSCVSTVKARRHTIPTPTGRKKQ